MTKKYKIFITSGYYRI